MQSKNTDNSNDRREFYRVDNAFELSVMQTQAVDIQEKL